MSLLHHHDHKINEPTPPQELDQATPQEMLPTEDLAQDVGSSVIARTDALPAYPMREDAEDKKSGLKRKVVRIGAPFVAAAALGGALIGFKGNNNDEVKPTPSTLAMPAPGEVNPNTPTTLSPDNRLAPGTQRLVKTVDGSNIDYVAFPHSLLESSDGPKVNFDQQLFVYSKEAVAKVNTSSTNKKGSVSHDLPVAVGETVFIRDHYTDKADGKIHNYYLVLVNPVRFDNEDGITSYYANTDSEQLAYTVDKSSAQPKLLFGTEYSVVDENAGKLTNMQISSALGSSRVKPDANIWSPDTGSLATNNSSGSKTIVGGIVSISDPQRPDLELSADQKNQIAHELLSKTTTH